MDLFIGYLQWNTSVHGHYASNSAAMYSCAMIAITVQHEYIALTDLTPPVADNTVSLLSCLTGWDHQLN